MGNIDPVAYFHYGGKQLTVMEHTSIRLLFRRAGTGSLLYVVGGRNAASEVLDGLTPEQCRYIDYLLSLDMKAVIRVSGVDGMDGADVGGSSFSSYLTVYANVDVGKIMRSRGSKGSLWKNPQLLWDWLDRGISKSESCEAKNQNYWIQDSVCWSLDQRISTFGSEEERMINPVVRQCF